MWMLHFSLLAFIYALFKDKRYKIRRRARGSFKYQNKHWTSKTSFHYEKNKINETRNIKWKKKVYTYLSCFEKFLFFNQLLKIC